MKKSVNKVTMTTDEKVFNLCVESAKRSESGYVFTAKEVWTEARKKYKMNKDTVADAIAILISEGKVAKKNEETVVVELMPKEKEVPIMEQWQELKAKHPNSLLLFRCGDFYETFNEDAKNCSDVLGITLTVRNSDKTKLAGFPYHALDTYLPKLIRAGFRIAICDPLVDPKVKVESPLPEKKKEVRRGYGRELTPCEVINLDAQKRARELYPDTFKRFTFFRFDTTNKKEYKNVDAALRDKADMNNLLYGIEVVKGIRYTGKTRINAYENFLAAATV